MDSFYQAGVSFFEALYIALLFAAGIGLIRFTLYIFAVDVYE